MTRDGLSIALEGAAGSTLALLAGGVVLAALGLLAVVLANDGGGGSYELPSIEYVNGRKVPAWPLTPEEEAQGLDMTRRSLRADGGREGDA
jgi:hypothetical protein